MLKKLLFFIALFLSVGAVAQDSIRFKSIRPLPKKKDSIILSSRDYKYISISRDTIEIDTTLTLKAMYKQNPVRGYVCLRAFPKYGADLYYSCL